MPSFDNKKRLRFIITLGTSNFDSKGNDQIILEGYRATADITLAGGIQMGELRGRIYGVKQSDMNAVTSYGWRFGAFIPNTVVVYAIDGLTESLVFAGNIVNAWADYVGMPDVFLNIQAQAAYIDIVKAVPPRSFKGAVDVASVMAQIAASMGYTFENNGVNVKLSNVYLANTSMEQAKELANAAGIDLYPDRKVLAITPRGVARKSLIPLISPKTGLIGYPVFSGVYLDAQTIYNAGIMPGGEVKIESEAYRANGIWQVLSMSHRLESEKPNGAWFTSFRGIVNASAITGR